MSSLIKSISELAGPAVISAVAGKLGESESGVAKAIGAFIPTILSGMIEKVGSADGLESLFGTLSAPETGGFLDDLGGLVGGGNLAQGDPRDVAGGLMGAMFGDKVGGILSAVSGLAGFGENGSAGGLLGMVGPMVMGFLGKKIAAEGLGAMGLKDLLLGEKDEVYAAVPQAVAGLIGVTAPAAIVTAGAASTTASAAAPAATGSVGWLKWMIPVIAIGAFGWWLFRADKAAPVSSDEGSIVVQDDGHDMADEHSDAGQQDMPLVERVETVDNTAAGALEVVDERDGMGAVDETASETVVNSEAQISDEVDLSSVVPGVDLTEFSDGVEGKLVRFIESETEPCTAAECWFTMDRLTFESGSSRVDVERSMDQLNKIKSIMEAYPTLQLKFGGYTDNTGDAASNLTLSQYRADSVVTTLVGMGVDGERMSAEGYGIEFPVASNETPEGRAQNRRIDIRVKQR